MSKQVLQETMRGNFVLKEGTVKDPKKCLGTMVGPCADYKNPTRNGNFYSRKLWENVFNNDLVKEALEDRVLIGELDHPQDGRLEVMATNACIVMTDYDFDDANQLVIGTFDILPTPQGKILKSLLDYGCKVGVSSRGEGDIEVIEGVNNVNEEGYDFVCFDAVTLPAVKKAKPSLSESVKRKGLKESLQEQINSATTKMELELVENVIKTTEMPELDSLLESINNKYDEIEGINGSSNLVNDLESSTKEIQRLESLNKSLNQNLINSKTRLKRMTESEKKVKESNSQLETELNELRESYKELKTKYINKSRKVKSLEESITQTRKGYDTLKTKCSRLESKERINSQSVDKSQQKVKSLEESLEKSQSVCQSKIKENKKLKSEINSLNKKIDSLNTQLSESQKALNESIKKNKETKIREAQSIKSYAKSLAESKGINSKRVLNQLNEGMTTKDVDKIVQDELATVDRYSKINIAPDPILESLTRNAKVSMNANTVVPTSEEEQDSLEFTRQFYHKK